MGTESNRADKQRRQSGEDAGMIYPAQVLEGLKNDHEIVMNMKKLHLDLSKLTYEWYGIDYQKTDNDIYYENDVYNHQLVVHVPRVVDWSKVDWGSLGDPSNKRDACNAFILFFRHEVGLLDYIIAGMMGCLEHESKFKSHIVNKSEKYALGIQQSSAEGQAYGVGLWANTFLDGNKGKAQKKISPPGVGWLGWGYAFEAQPMSVQMHVSFAQESGDKFRSLAEAMQIHLPWKPDIINLVKKRLVDIKEITPEEETGYNQYWDREKDLSELEILAVHQACDAWSWCGEHGTYGFLSGPSPTWLSIRDSIAQPRWWPPHPANDDHQIKRRKSAIMYYKYMKCMIAFSEDF